MKLAQFSYGPNRYWPRRRLTNFCCDSDMGLREGIDGLNYIGKFNAKEKFFRYMCAQMPLLCRYKSIHARAYMPIAIKKSLDGLTVNAQHHIPKSPQ